MKTTSNNSGADEAERYFNKHYRDENGKVLWDKIKEVMRNKKPSPAPEWLVRLRASNPDQKKGDGNSGQAA